MCMPVWYLYSVVYTLLFCVWSSRKLGPYNPLLSVLLLQSYLVCFFDFLLLLRSL